MGKKSSDDSNKTLIWIICGIVVVVIIIILLLRGCGPKQYSIKFDTNGGTVVSSMTVEENGTITKPTNPTRDGYEFAGWYLDGKLFDFNTKITGDMTLEARWTKIDDSGIILSATSTTLKVNETETLVATLTGDATGSELVWSSSNNKIVSVDSNGKIKALKEGSATITVTTKDGKYSAQCTVTVTDKDVETLKVTISGKNTVEIGSTITLKANVTPKGTKITKTVWKSSNDCVTVSENGVVTGVKAGTVTVTVTITDENNNVKSASIKITVTSKPEEKNSYKVTFNSNGGSNVETQTIEEGSNATKPSNPTRSGYKFAGWYLDDKEYDFSSPVTKDITLVAKWEAEYVVTLTPVDMGAGMSGYQYEVKVTKAGETFEGYQGFYIEGKARYVHNSGYMKAASLDGLNNPKNVEITLTDGTKVSGTLIIKD